MVAEWLYSIWHLSMLKDRLFRGGASALLAGLLVFFLMPPFIRFLNKIDATSDFVEGKQPPSIFGGWLLVFSVIVSSLFFSKLNGFSIATLLILLTYFVIGAWDDIMKVKNKKAIREGKLSKAEYAAKADGISARLRLFLYFLFSILVSTFAVKYIPDFSTHLTIPFVKPGTWYPELPVWGFVILMSLVITGTANGANFTDGIDTLISIPIITACVFIAAASYVSGNKIFADYLLLPFSPGIDELMPICTAMIGATLSYLWYNSPPAEVYMGDGGAIGLGGAIGAMFVLVKAELFLPIICFVFLAEALSSAMQTTGFKITKRFRADKQGKRIFLRAPLHEHYRVKWKAHFESPLAANSKLLWRFHLVSILVLLVGSIIFFKIR